MRQRIVLHTYILYMSYQTIQSRLQQAKREPQEQCRAFYKRGVGEYAEYDQFIGVSMPELRKIAKDFKRLQIDDVQRLLKSSVNEERLLALFVLIDQYHHQAALAQKETLYRFYLQNLKYVNNWNLVDASAHLFTGAHLFSTVIKACCSPWLNHKSCGSAALPWLRRYILHETITLNGRLKLP